MIRGINAIKDGDSYDLMSGGLTFCTAYSGLGMAKPRNILNSGPLQHGATMLGWNYQPRTVSLALLLKGDSLPDLAWKREAVYSLFAREKRPLQLLFDLWNDQYRALDVYLDDDVDLPYDGQTGLYIPFGARLLATDPMFYAPEVLVVSYRPPVGSTSTPIPTAIPTPIGTSALGDMVTVQMRGQFDDHPIIYIKGPISAPQIKNLATNKLLKFPNLTLGANELIEINCRYGYKTVTDQAGVNRIADLSGDSHLSTFAFAAHPTVQYGFNDIQVLGTGAAQGTEIIFQYRHKYLGL